MAAEPTGAINVFYSYAQEDALLREELDRHLGTMRRLNLIVGWHNRDIQAGKDWEQEINEHLNTAQIILLLISPDFIASDYCYSIEMMRAIERHKNGEARVIPIILRPVDVEGVPFSELEMLPTDKRPVTSWTDRDAAFLNVTQGIREVVRRFLSPTKEQLLEEGLAHHKARRFEQALKVFEQAIQLDPGYARPYRSRGDVLYDLKRYEEALGAYEQAIHLDPNHTRIHRNRGDILFRLKRYEEALAAYDYATKLDSTSASAFTNKGNALSRLTHYQEAIAAYEQAIRLNPNDAFPHNNKGRALHHLGRYNEALAAFEQALRLDPHFKGAYNNMADTLERLGRVEEAKAARARAQQIGG